MGWLRLFGHSDLAARAFGAVLGVATVVVVYARWAGEPSMRRRPCGGPG